MKSYVSMEQHVCPICHTPHDTGALLLDKHLEASMSRNTLTGYSLCPEHEEMALKGYTALVEISNDDNTPLQKPDNVTPTGRFAHISAGALRHLFGIEQPTKLLYVTIEVFDQLLELHGSLEE